MNEIPFEERRIIRELVELWQTHHEPRGLATHINRLPTYTAWGSGIGTSFFRQVYKDLCNDRRSSYIASSASEFERFLEAEYQQRAQKHAEPQAQAKAQAERLAQVEKEQAERLAQAQVEKEQAQARARAIFDALGKEMEKATTHAERVELGRKRDVLAPATGVFYVYESHCWKCKARISEAIHARCPDCGYYICGSCCSCLCGYTNERLW